MDNSTIIVITQNENSLDYKDILKKEVEYYSFKKGIEMISKHIMGLVIMDCGLETISCIGLLKEIKRIQPELPVIFVTEVSGKALTINSFKSGVRDYFVKPFDRNDFRKTVEWILRLKHANLNKRLALTSVIQEDSLGEWCPAVEIPEILFGPIRFIEKNLANLLNLEMIVKEAGMSKYHFCRLFKQHVGMSPMQLVIRMRIKKAMAFLKREDYAISLVASQSGFNDISEFNRQFKKIVGITPSSFRAFVISNLTSIHNNS